ALPSGRPAAPLPFRNCSRSRFSPIAACFTDYLHFALECDAHLAFHGLLNQDDQFFDIVGKCVALVDDEVGMLERYLRCADTHSLQSTGFDQSSGVIPRRVAEYRSRVGLTQRLAGDAARQEVLDGLTGTRAVAVTKAEPGRNKELVLYVERNDVAIADGVLLWRADLQSSAAIDGAHAGHHIPGLCAVAPGIHGQRAADRTRNAGQELGAFEVVQGREAGHFRAGDAGLGVDLRCAGPFVEEESLQRWMRKHHGAADAAVAYQQVAAEADEEYRLGIRQAAKEYAQVVEIGRQEGAVGSPTCTPAGVSAHRLVAPQFAAQRGCPQWSLFRHIHRRQQRWRLSFPSAFISRPWSWPHSPARR